MLARFRARRPNHTTIVAYLALFVAVPGGTAFAAVIAANKVNSASIIDGQVKNQDIANSAVGGLKIKDGAVGGGKVANDSLGGIDINEGSLGTVPFATNALNATNATAAASATTATNAGHATTAGNADTVDGRNATCPAGTVLFLGQCFEAAERTAAGYGVALTDCGGEGGYLPPTDQLLAFMALPADNQGANPEQGAELWTIGDGADQERQWRVDEDTTSEATYLGGANAPYRCVFPLVH